MALKGVDVQSSPKHNRAEELETLHQRTKELHLFEFWSENYEVEHEAAQRLQKYDKAIPHIWRFRDVEPCLLKAAELIDMYMSERRSLIMMNPALKGAISTVTTMFVAYRITMPGDIAPPHRHSPNAVRLGLTGPLNFTNVEGEGIHFGPGDLVLTPHDTWHNHGNDSAEGAINYNVLDMPLVNVLNATYFDSDYTEGDERKDVQSDRFPENYSELVYGKGGLKPRCVSHHRGTGNSSPNYVYRWDNVRELLERFRDFDGNAYEGIGVEYIDPVTGKPPYSTMTFFAQMLRPNERTLPLRQNASVIYQVFQGKGHSIIGGQRFDWEQFDTFCVPGGEWCEHVNENGDDTIFFVASDEPVLKALGLYLRHGKTKGGDIIRLAD